jgi:hypothetical protein
LTVPVPAYVITWHGKQITWKDDGRLLSGRVTEVVQRVEYDKRVIRLRVVRDDGFLTVGLDAQDVLSRE